MRDPILKAFGVAVQPLDDRQIRVVVSTDQVDRVGDVVVQKGIRFGNFQASRTVLWNHDQDHPVAACSAIGLNAEGQLEATTRFPEPGISAKADEVYGLLKAGVINAASVGFLPLAAEPLDPRNPRKGLRIDESELLEFSFVSVPANPGAQVLQRAARLARRTPFPMRKGLYSVAQLAFILHQLAGQVEAAFAERGMEGDDSAVPDQLHAALTQLGEAMVAMTSEEVGELLAGHGQGNGDGAAMLDGPDCGPMYLRLASAALKRVDKSGRKFSAATATAMRAHLKSIGDAHGALCGMLADAPDGDDEAKHLQAQLQDQRRRLVETLALG